MSTMTPPHLSCHSPTLRCLISSAPLADPQEAAGTPTLVLEAAAFLREPSPHGTPSLAGTLLSQDAPRDASSRTVYQGTVAGGGHQGQSLQLRRWPLSYFLWASLQNPSLTSAHDIAVPLGRVRTSLWGLPRTDLHDPSHPPRSCSTSLEADGACEWEKGHVGERTFWNWHVVVYLTVRVPTSRQVPW